MPPKASLGPRPRRAARATAKRTTPTSLALKSSADEPSEAPHTTTAKAAAASSAVSCASKSSTSETTAPVSKFGNSSVKATRKSSAEDQSEAAAMGTSAVTSLISPETAAKRRAKARTASSAKVSAEDAAQIHTSPILETTPLTSPEFSANASLEICCQSDSMAAPPVTSARLVTETRPPSKNGESGDQNTPEETLAATAAADVEASLTHKNVDKTAQEITTHEVAGGGTAGAKPGMKRTVRIVKKVVKKKVLKKVPKGAAVCSNKALETAEVPGHADSPKPVVPVSVKEVESPNSTASPNKELEKAEVPGGAENPNPIASVSVKEVENPSSSTVNTNPNVSVPLEEVESLNPNVPVSMEVENSNSNVTVSMEVEKPNESECCDGVKDSGAVEVPLEGHDLDLEKARISGNGAEKPISGTETAVEVLNADSIADKTENVDSGDVGMEEVENDRASKRDGHLSNVMMVLSEEMEALERRKRRRTEIFIGGLDEDVKEEDIRKVFEEVGKVVEVRLMMKGHTGKNKGYAFLRYASAADAKKALEKYSKVKICGKQCGAAPVEGNDTIFLGNIDKNWKNEDVVKLLQEIGIEKIDKVTVMPDPSNIERNRGFAFLELETSRDAQNAFKKLQKKDVFGKHLKIKVAWAEPLKEPDEEEMLKVKSVYVEFIPSSWDEEKVRDFFKKFGEVDNVVLSRNLYSSKRKDFAFVNFMTREAALTCIDSFSRELFDDEGSKVNVKVSLAKPIPKGKQNKRASNPVSKEIPKEKPNAATQRVAKPNNPGNKGKSMVYTRSDYQDSKGDRSSSATAELLQLLREQASWKQTQTGFRLDSVNVDYPYSLSGGKRSFSALEDDPFCSDPRGYPRTRLDLESPFPVASPSYDAYSHGVGMTSLPGYYQRHGAVYRSGNEFADYTSSLQSEEAPYHGSAGLYRRY